MLALKHPETEQSVSRIAVGSKRCSRGWIRRGAAVVVAGSIAFAAGIGCNRSNAQAGAHERPPPAVTVAPAMAQDVPVYLDHIGRTAPLELVNVMPQVTGRVIERPFVDGAEVTPKDVLFKIDPRPYEATLAQADANLKQQQLAVDWANLEFNRIKNLVGNKAISQQDYDQKQNAVAVADAQLKAAKAAVEQAKLNLEYCTIHSPIDGRTGQRQVDVGNVVKANEGTLVTVQNLNKIYADFVIPERDLQQVREKMADSTLKVEVWLPNEAELQKMQVATATPSTAGNPGTAGNPTTRAAVAQAPAAQPIASAPAAPASRPAVRTGDLTFLDTAVQPGLGTVRLRATLENKDRYFWPGQFVNVRLILETRKNAVLVPLQALQIGQRGPFVYVVKADSTAEMVPVQRGQRQGDSVVILSGVTPGQRVIVTGQAFVGPGAKVTVVQGVAGL